MRRKTKALSSCQQPIVRDAGNKFCLLFSDREFYSAAAPVAATTCATAEFTGTLAAPIYYGHVLYKHSRQLV